MSSFCICFLYMHRWMYWTDWGTTPKIERASMDGTSRQTIHSTILDRPQAITMDYQNQILYWMDYDLDRLESSNPDGSARTLLTTTNIVSPFAMNYYDGKLYWTDWSLKRVVFTPLSSPGIISYAGNSLSSTPYGLQIISPDRQPIGW